MAMRWRVLVLLFMVRAVMAFQFGKGGVHFDIVKARTPLIVAQFMALGEKIAARS